jgi:hypothetical protein
MPRRQRFLEIAARNFSQINNWGRCLLAIPTNIRAWRQGIRKSSVRLWDTACPLVNTGHSAQFNHKDLKDL